MICRFFRGKHVRILIDFANHGDVVDVVTGTRVFRPGWLEALPAEYLSLFEGRFATHLPVQSAEPTGLAASVVRKHDAQL